MTHFKKIVSVVLSVTILLSVVTVGFPLNISAATVKVAYINGSDVNVRKSASTSSEKVDTISHREVTVTGTSGNWLKVQYKSSGKTKKGYIYNNNDYVYITDYDLEASFKNQLKNFPESYHDALKELHKKYPNWNFIPDKVDLSFNEAVSMQMEDMRKQVSGSGHPVSWRSMGKGSYDWDTGLWQYTNGGWTGASKQTIAYYMDPRNFLNDEEIYMFLKQGYEYGSYTEKGLEKILEGTFLAKGYSDPKNTEGYNGSYIKILMEAGKQSGVSPYVLAAALRQEQGANGTSELISGTYVSPTKGKKYYKGYYNFFNYSASGGNTTAVIENGLDYAKEMGWNTRAKSIIGGAKKFIEGYIEIGQDTYFYQDFNINFYNRLWHQYAQAVHDARSKGYSLNKVYKDAEKSELTFRIPVYSSMPETASKRPVENNKRNNYYFSDIEVSGLTPSFSRYNYEYDLRVTDDTVIDVEYPDTATFASKREFSLKKGTNNITLKVKSQTGYTNSYKITITATKACMLYINISGSSVNDKPNTSDKTESENSSSNSSQNTSSSEDKKEPDSGESEPTYKLGDVNGDSKITASDMANIRLHVLGKYILKQNNFKAADINKDGKITASDMANVRLHLLGKYKIK